MPLACVPTRATPLKPGCPCEAGATDAGATIVTLGAHILHISPFRLVRELMTSPVRATLQLILRAARVPHASVCLKVVRVLVEGVVGLETLHYPGEVACGLCARLLQQLIVVHADEHRPVIQRHSLNAKRHRRFTQLLFGANFAVVRESYAGRLPLRGRRQLVEEVVSIEVLYSHDAVVVGSDKRAENLAQIARPVEKPAHPCRHIELPPSPPLCCNRRSCERCPGLRCPRIHDAAAALVVGAKAFGVHTVGPAPLVRGTGARAAGPEGAEVLPGLVGRGRGRGRGRGLVG
eukprot:scaffold10448_cov68-Phaeocystis_antarctica.AAC.9